MPMSPITLFEMIDCILLLRLSTLKIPGSITSPFIAPQLRKLQVPQLMEEQDNPNEAALEINQILQPFSEDSSIKKVAVRKLGMKSGDDCPKFTRPEMQSVLNCFQSFFCLNAGDSRAVLAREEKTINGVKGVRVSEENNAKFESFFCFLFCRLLLV
ncbi:hypothetical protein LXL04_009887 [Taraxacum kok-saghyz]